MMYQWMYGMYGLPFAFGALLPLVLLWSAIWKGLALWHAAKRNHPIWFVVLLVLNTVGILEIIYLFAIEKLSMNEVFPFLHNTNAKAAPSDQPSHDRSDAPGQADRDRAAHA